MQIAGELAGNINGKVLRVEMEIRSFRDNELIAGISILAVLRRAKQLDIAKCMLIEPILSYSMVMNVFKRKKSSVKSIEDLIIREHIAFADFNDRFKEKLLLSMNSIILFKQMDLIQMDGEWIVFNGNSFDFSRKDIGQLATARIKAAYKLAEILQKGDASDLYLSLRIEL